MIQNPGSCVGHTGFGRDLSRRWTPASSDYAGTANWNLQNKSWCHRVRILLSDFIQRSQPWSRERVPVPRPTSMGSLGVTSSRTFLGYLAGDHSHRSNRMPRTDLYGHHPRPPRRSATRLRRF